MKNFYTLIKTTAFAVLVLLMSVQAEATTILGDYFGITLSQNGSGDFNNSWVSSKVNADKNIQDWDSTTGAPNPSPGGTNGEAFDVEAMYFDNDATYAYIAIVTSIPNTGYAGSLFGWNSNHFDASDIAIDLNPGDPAFNYQYGIETTGLDFDGAGPLVAGSAGSVRKNATWTYDDGSAGYPNGYPTQSFAQTPNMHNDGTLQGAATTFSYYNAGLALENGWTTWVVEALISLAYFENPANGTSLILRFSPDCNNDLLFLNADIDIPSGPETRLVPEPSSLLLLGLGISISLILGYYRKRKVA